MHTIWRGHVKKKQTEPRKPFKLSSVGKYLLKIKIKMKTKKKRKKFNFKLNTLNLIVSFPPPPLSITNTPNNSVDFFSFSLFAPNCLINIFSKTQRLDNNMTWQVEIVEKKIKKLNLLRKQIKIVKKRFTVQRKKFFWILFVCKASLSKNNFFCFNVIWYTTSLSSSFKTKKDLTFWFQYKKSEDILKLPKKN